MMSRTISTEYMRDLERVVASVQDIRTLFGKSMLVTGGGGYYLLRISRHTSVSK